MTRHRFAAILRSEGITAPNVIEQVWRSRPRHKFTEKDLRDQCRINLADSVLRIAQGGRERHKLSDAAIQQLINQHEERTRKEIDAHGNEKED